MVSSRLWLALRRRRRRSGRRDRGVLRVLREIELRVRRVARGGSLHTDQPLFSSRPGGCGKEHHYGCSIFSIPYSLFPCQVPNFMAPLVYEFVS